MSVRRNSDQEASVTTLCERGERGDNTEASDTEEASDEAGFRPEDTLMDRLEPPDTAGGRGGAGSGARGLQSSACSPGGGLCQRDRGPGGAELGSQICL